MAHSQRPIPSSRDMVSSAIQRGRVAPKRSPSQHSRPPIKGIRISQGKIMTGSIPFAKSQGSYQTAAITTAPSTNTAPTAIEAVYQRS
ncbi:hypothetical protein D9M71_689680 [compost metagenome]